MIELLTLLLFLPVCYAETHYRFKYFFSYLYKSEPEIIADIPSRIEPESRLPVLIIVKDAHRFPVLLDKIEVINSVDETLLTKIDINMHIDLPYWEKIVNIPVEDLTVGTHFLNICMYYSMGGRKNRCVNDNHRGTTHKPLPVYIADEVLPQIDNCVYGDTHVHSNYSSDQVEFGASLESTLRMAQAMGIQFFCATDHSYDLDDDPEDYLISDPELRKWAAFLNEAQRLNNENREFVVIPGEEVSVRNSAEKTVHCLVFNSKQFFPGSGDGAEEWPNTRCELSLIDLLQQLPDQALAFAAHPGERPPFLQRLLIRRGIWNQIDFNTNGLTGLQVINCADEISDQRGLSDWIKGLLSGQRLIGICGSDAHGNFARYRQIDFPFFTMRENYQHLFGQWRTGVYSNQVNPELEELLTGLQKGYCFMTNGPALRFGFISNNQWFDCGSEYNRAAELRIKTKTSKEFARLQSVVVYIGHYGQTSEEILKKWILKPGIYEFEDTLQFNPPSGHGYLRCEVVTALNRKAISNPIWF
jgi:hypothetical protein